MRLGQGLAGDAGVARFGRQRRQLGADQAQPRLGAGIGVVYPEAPAVPARFAELQAERGQGPKSGKGPDTAFATLGALASPTKRSMSETTCYLA